MKFRTLPFFTVTKKPIVFKAGIITISLLRQAILPEQNLYEKKQIYICPEEQPYVFENEMA